MGVALLAYFVTRVKELNTESNITRPYNKCGTHDDLVWKSLRLLHQVLFFFSLALSHIHFVFPTTALLTHTHMHMTQSLSPHTCAHTHTQASLVKACESVRRCKDVTGKQSVWVRRLPASFHLDGNNKKKKKDCKNKTLRSNVTIQILPANDKNHLLGTIYFTLFRYSVSQLWPLHRSLTGLTASLGWHFILTPSCH